MNMSLLGKDLPQRLNGQEIDYFLTELGSMSKLLDRSVKSVRKIISDLRPEVLVNLNLIDALEWQIDEFNRLPGIKCSFKFNGSDRNFNSQFTTAAFRIVQEALTNVRRHSLAKTVYINLHRDDKKVILSIKDDGVGIKDYKKRNTRSFGLLGIRERAILLGGNLEIKSSSGTGTELIITVLHEKTI